MAGTLVPEETKIEVGGTTVVVLRAGTGRPLLVLHDELGHPGWMRWNDALAERYELIMPLQPGYGATARIDWVRSHRDLAAFYNRMVREQGWGPVDVIGFSAGGYIAAEMVAAAPELFGKVVLVAPLGLRPLDGEIFDFLAVTIRTHVAATVSNVDAPEFSEIYGGDMTPLQFELFEDARAETARIGWEPFMFNDSLGPILEGVATVPFLLVWGTADLIAPRGEIAAYEAVLPNATTVEIPGAGHRPEIEDPDAFLAAVKPFLGV